MSYFKHILLLPLLQLLFQMYLKKHLHPHKYELLLSNLDKSYLLAWTTREIFFSFQCGFKLYKKQFAFQSSKINKFLNWCFKIDNNHYIVKFFFRLCENYFQCVASFHIKIKTLGLLPPLNKPVGKENFSQL